MLGYIFFAGRPQGREKAGCRHTVGIPKWYGQGMPTLRATREQYVFTELVGRTTKTYFFSSVAVLQWYTKILRYKVIIIKILWFAEVCNPPGSSIFFCALEILDAANSNI